MYETQTFEAIMERMLSRVPDNLDKREGSLIWNALAPAAAELAQMYIELGLNENLAFADTATGEYLSRRTSERGVNRKPATKAIRKGEFFDRNNAPMDIPIGSRFSIENLNYTAIERIATGVYRMECEKEGVIGNQLFGNLLPIQNINGLASAVLTDILVPGEDEEPDEHLRERYFEDINEPAFGGNVADYKRKVNGISGVGATKVFPTWQGGGTVKCTFIASDWSAPSAELVNQVQEIIDPVSEKGQGLGLAPIGHKVTISGVSEVNIDVTTTISLEPGMTIAQVQNDIEQAIGNYLLGLRKNWANENQTIVRVALIDSAILSVSGVIDVNGTHLNGSTSNITLGEEEIPILRTVTLNE